MFLFLSFRHRIILSLQHLKEMGVLRLLESNQGPHDQESTVLPTRHNSSQPKRSSHLNIVTKNAKSQRRQLNIFKLIGKWIQSLKVKEP